MVSLPVASTVIPSQRLLAQPRTVILEFAALLLLALLYFNPYPAFNAGATFDGVEHERLAGILIPVEIGLREYGSIPTWNSQMWRGVPLLNNGFFFLYNPFVSLPMLLFGALQGSKIAMMLCMFIGSVNMWLFMRALGVGALARVTAGGLFMMSGGIVSKLSSGQFQLGLSLVWIPLVLAGLWWTLHTRDRRAPVLMAVGFALLFFAGNIYYTLHTLVCCAMIYAFFALRKVDGHWHVDRVRLRRVIIGGTLALLLAAVQFLPIWTVREMVSHVTVALNPANPNELADRYDLFTSFAHLTIPEPRWTRVMDARSDIELRLNVDYAYIGAWSLLTILPAGWFALTIPQARSRLKPRAALIALLLALIMMIWGGGMTFIVNWLYLNIDLLAEFRFIGRANAVAALWWIVLGGLALDVLWRTAGDIFPMPAMLARVDRRRMLRALALGVGAWLAAAFYVNLPNIDLYRGLAAAGQIDPMQAVDEFRAYYVDPATESLWLFLAVALLLDTLLLAGGKLSSPPAPLHFVERGAIQVSKVTKVSAPFGGGELRSDGFRGGDSKNLNLKTSSAPQRKEGEQSDGKKIFQLGREGEQRGGDKISLLLRRAVRIVPLGIALLALWDVMAVNNPVINAGSIRVTDFDALYAYIREQEPDVPFLIINEPDTQNRMFRAYYAGVRNWGVDEGWRPAAIANEIGGLFTFPRWLIVQDATDKTAQPDAAFPYTPVMQQCENSSGTALGPLQTVEIYADFPCAVLVPQLTVGALYEIDGTLPYAFVVDRDRLYNYSQDLRREETHPVRAIEYKQDTIILHAAPPEGLPPDAPEDSEFTPSNRAEYYLIVQETFFPGWQVFVDGAPVQASSFDGYMGIPLLDGEHTYTLRYQPPSLASGFALSLLGIVLCGVYVRRGNRRQFKTGD